MNRCHHALMAFVVALASGGVTVSAQASAINAAGHAVSASHDRAALPRAYSRHQLLALSTAEMIYMHESLAGSLVSMTPSALPAPPVAPHGHKALPAIRK